MSVRLRAKKVLLSVTILACFIVPLTISESLFAENRYELYPVRHEVLPELPSPYIKGCREFVVAGEQDGVWSLVPVTVENGGWDLLRGSVRFGKGNQLFVDGSDFPVLFRDGLHDNEMLATKKTITGLSVEVISEDARPGRASREGFIAEDEDIISVIIADNKRVQALDLTHPELARPLFHVFNILVEEYRMGNDQRWSSFSSIRYNSAEISVRAQASKGFQYSIFNDDVMGTYRIELCRTVNEEEMEYLKREYAHLSDVDFDGILEKLATLHFGEIAPYYIMRYGFYEGHTSYRADPLAIAFIFNMRGIEEIDKAVDGDLLTALTEHFYPE